MYVFQYIDDIQLSTYNIYYIHYVYSTKNMYSSTTSTATIVC